MPTITTVTLPGALVAALEDRDSFQDGRSGGVEQAVAEALYTRATRVKRGKGVSVLVTLTAEQSGALADYLHSLLGLVDAALVPASEFGVSRARLAAIVREVGDAQNAAEAEDARQAEPQPATPEAPEQPPLAPGPTPTEVAPAGPGKFIVTLDEIRVHCVPVLAPTREAAQREAARIVAADQATWYDHTEPLCVGDAQTEAEWDAEQESLARMGINGMVGPLSVSRPKDTPKAKFQAPRTDHHADDSECPPAHKHTSSGKPLVPECPGRAYSTAACTCGWTTRSAVKTYVDETRRRHLATEHG
ncbi:hypothetical protein [Kitasatospora purpeofusca]|uniref:Lsr2 protein n=1 Tax=Kitasatospora purpeofusca TaxID=67352 RepID=A0ABZ1U032_9ACTN|nr:hypothetical protein [Kitasatospora purpeofusca]